MTIREIDEPLGFDTEARTLSAHLGPGLSALRSFREPFPIIEPGPFAHTEELYSKGSRLSDYLHFASAATSCIPNDRPS
jgi:hypothetical protein